jgi:hypothetical protein
VLEAPVAQLLQQAITTLGALRGAGCWCWSSWRNRGPIPAQVLQGNGSINLGEQITPKQQPEGGKFAGISV